MGAAVGHLHDRRDDILAAHAFRVEELGHAELAAPLLSGPVDVDANDLVRTGKPRALDHVQSDAAEPEDDDIVADRSEEHTSELQSLMRISYAVFCLKKKNT